MRAFMAELDSVSNDFSGTMFMDVHEIVHDSFLFFITVMSPVVKRVFGIVGFSVSCVFMNNWVILFFAVVFPKCDERRFLLDR